MIRPWGRGLWLALLACASAPAWAGGTPAGTGITSSAQVDYLTDGAAQSLQSAALTLTVDEVLDVTAVSNDTGNVGVTSPDLDAPLSFTITNTGNGTESFELKAEGVSGDDFDAANSRIYLDDGDGLFDAAADTLYALNGNDPVLAPDATRVVFIVSDIPSGLANDALGSRRLRATAVTAGATGNAVATVFGGQGDGGGDAIVGPTTASALALASYQVGQVSASIVKSLSVLGADGSLAPARGATVTYTLTLTVSGRGDLSNTRIVDPIPAGTTYVGNSLTLDDGSGPVGLSDGADGDAGRFDSGATPSRVEVQLGSVAAPATRIVTFKVTIN